MMEETRHAQCNVLNYIALCDILQTFKTFHIALNYISVMMAFRPVSLTAIAVPCFPIVKLLNQIFGHNGDCHAHTLLRKPCL